LKRIFLFFWGLAGVVVLMMAASYFYELHLGRDEQRLEIKTDHYRFSADRNSVGVWNLKVQRAEDLWFAFGYLQMFDREFQMELLRNASLGKLSAIVGEKAITRDRLMRAAARSAQVEWAQMDEKSLIRRSSQAFVDGVQAFKSSSSKGEPVEFQMMGLKRSTNEAWSPWELLAIARYQAWQFSYDLEHEVFFERLKTLLKKDSLQLSDYFPRVGTTEGKYEAQKLGASLRSWKDSLNTLKPFWTPREDLGPIESRIPKEFTQNSSGPDVDLAWEKVLDHWATLGASNAWIISKPTPGKPGDPTVWPTLCNDTHLRLAWPSPLYPIRYDLDGKIQATGFTLPGVPGIILGNIENATGRRFAWAITLGNYADAQDLIVDRAHKAKVQATVKERFLVKNPKTSFWEERVVEEKWTQFGLDVTDLYESEILAPAGAEKPAGRPRIYLDWIGFRQQLSPLDFYLRRNLYLDQNIEEELHTDWDYPVVNFSWMASPRNGPVDVGHVITGMQFARNRKASPGLLDSEKLNSRRTVRLGSEKYFRRTLGNDEFYMVSANQKPFTNSSTEDVAYSWEPNTRADRIFDSRSRTIERPETEQTDYYSATLIEFFQRSRTRVSANQICQIGSNEERDFCFRLWSRIEKWNGLLEATSWEASVISLWMSLSKQLIMPENYPWTDPNADKFFREYTQKSFSDLALLQIMRSDLKISQWEKSHQKLFVKRLGELFSESLKILVENRGPDARFWAWGSMHAVDWYYPLGEAPEPWGTLIEESFLGPPHEVGGGFDSPGSFEFQWSPKNPADFATVHGAAMRACYEFKPGEPAHVRWAAPNGPSGNPFSKWSRLFATRSYFKGRLIPADDK
jgi:acyl-homoserine lactone acylase PvdQ